MMAVTVEGKRADQAVPVKQQDLSQLVGTPLPLAERAQEGSFSSIGGFILSQTGRRVESPDEGLRALQDTLRQRFGSRFGEGNEGLEYLMREVVAPRLEDMRLNQVVERLRSDGRLQDVQEQVERKVVAAAGEIVFSSLPPEERSRMLREGMMDFLEQRGERIRISDLPEIEWGSTREMIKSVRGYYDRRTAKIGVNRERYGNVVDNLESLKELAGVVGSGALGHELSHHQEASMPLIREFAIGASDNFVFRPDKPGSDFGIDLGGFKYLWAIHSEGGVSYRTLEPEEIQRICKLEQDIRNRNPIEDGIRDKATYLLHSPYAFGILVTAKVEQYATTRYSEMGESEEEAAKLGRQIALDYAERVIPGINETMLPGREWRHIAQLSNVWAAMEKDYRRACEYLGEKPLTADDIAEALPDRAREIRREELSMRRVMLTHAQASYTACGERSMLYSAIPSYEPEIKGAERDKSAQAERQAADMYWERAVEYAEQVRESYAKLGELGRLGAIKWSASRVGRSLREIGSYVTWRVGRVFRSLSEGTTNALNIDDGVKDG